MTDVEFFSVRRVATLKFCGYPTQAGLAWDSSVPLTLSSIPIRFRFRECCDPSTDP